MAKADSPTKTCGEAGCARPLRARGLCTTHYNQKHQPNRHRKVTIACGWCDKPSPKQVTSRFAIRFCGVRCRDEWRKASGVNACPADNRLSCPVPWRTCSSCGLEWFRFGSDAVRCVHCADVAKAARAERAAIRLRRLIDVEQAMQLRPCDDCGVTYLPGTTVQRYCSSRCAGRVHRRERRARERGAQGTFSWTQVVTLFLLFNRQCAYCAERIDGQPDPDHVIPLSKRGHNTIGNILPSCRSCNTDKRDLMLHEWNADRARRGLPLRNTTWSSTDPRFAHLTAQKISHAV
jgi:hypothetical protein